MTVAWIVRGLALCAVAVGVIAAQRGLCLYAAAVLAIGLHVVIEAVFE